MAIILELQAKGWQRAEDLAATFEVSKRTIYRDMDALAESGVPVVSLPGQGYSLVEGYFLPPLSFTNDESMMLLLGSDVMAQSFDAEYQSAARSAANKIMAVLPETLRGDVQSLRERLRYIKARPAEHSDHTDKLQRIRRAIMQNRTVRFVYHTRHSGTPAGETKLRDADPYALTYYERAWYLTAYCHLRRSVRHFRLERIDDLELLTQTFEFVPDYQHEPDNEPRMFIKLLFEPSVARWVKEDSGFYSFDEEDTPDGLLVTLLVRTERDILPYVLRWGTHVHVLEPDSLRQMVIAEVECVLQNYQQR